jgi:hypothetical protein
MRDEDEIKDGLYIPKKKKSFELICPGFAYAIFFIGSFIIAWLVFFGGFPVVALCLIPLLFCFFLAVDTEYEHNHPTKEYDIGAH